MIVWGDYGGRSFAKSAEWVGQYLDGGGNLFLCGQDVLSSTYGYDPAYTDSGEFAHDYLKFTWVWDDAIQDSLPHWIYGAPGDTIAGSFEIDGIHYDPMNTWPMQSIWIGTCSTDVAIEIFFEFKSDMPCGWRYEGAKGYKYVFLYFQLESMEDTTDPGMYNLSHIRRLLYNTFRWFGMSPPPQIDVAVYSIDNPADGDSVDVGSDVTVAATVKNYGLDPATFDVVCEIDTSGDVIWADTVTVTDLASNAFGSESFAPWTVPAGESIDYGITVYHTLAGDVATGNDEDAITVTSKLPEGVEGKISIGRPLVFGLAQNRPNPMASKTTIHYSIPSTGKVSLKLYNAAGQVVKTLVNSIEKPGMKKVIWDGKDNRGSKVASGVYFYRLETGDKTATRKLVLVR